MQGFTSAAANRRRYASPKSHNEDTYAEDLSGLSSAGNGEQKAKCRRTGTTKGRAVGQPASKGRVAFGTSGTTIPACMTTQGPLDRQRTGSLGLNVPHAAMAGHRRSSAARTGFCWRSIYCVVAHYRRGIVKRRWQLQIALADRYNRRTETAVAGLTMADTWRGMHIIILLLGVLPP